MKTPRGRGRVIQPTLGMGVDETQGRLRMGDVDLDAQASRAMAAREAMAVSPEPGALVSARSLRAKMAGMVATAGMVALPEPGERAAPPAMR